MKLVPCRSGCSAVASAMSSSVSSTISSARALVLHLGDAGVGREDEVRIQREDLLEIELALTVDADDLRQLGAELVRDVVAEPFRVPVLARVVRRHSDRDDSERGHDVLGHPAERHDALGLGLDRGLAVRVLDGDGEGGVGRRGGGLGRRLGRFGGAARSEHHGGSDEEGCETQGTATTHGCSFSGHAEKA
jgi:hypothetical protein